MASPAFQALAAALCLAPGCTSASIPCGEDQAATVSLNKTLRLLKVSAR